MANTAYQINSGITRNAALSSAVTLTVPTNSTHIQVQVLSNDVVYTNDGTTPTTSNGFILFKNTINTIVIHPNMTFKFIEYVAGAEIRYQFLTENAA